MSQMKMTEAPSYVNFMAAQAAYRAAIAAHGIPSTQVAAAAKILNNCRFQCFNEAGISLPRLGLTSE